MDLRDKLLNEYSKEMALEVTSYIEDSQERLEELLDLLEDTDAKVAQRAAWPLQYVFDNKPSLVPPNAQRLLGILEDPAHEAIPRGIMRAFSSVEIPEEVWGETLEIAFDYLQNPQVPVAIRVHSMQVIFNISQKIPEIGYELKLILEAQIHEGSAGFRSRANKLLKKLAK